MSCRRVNSEQRARRVKKGFRIFALCVWIAAVPGCTDAPNAGIAPPDRAEKEAGPVPEGRLPRDVVPVAYRLSLEIVPDASTFQGRADISISIREPLDRIWIHGQDLDVASVELVLPGDERIPAQYEQLHPDGISRIDLPGRVEPGEAHLEIAYSGRFADDVTGLFRTEYEGEAYVFSDFQPIQSRRAFPGFDEPSFKIPYDIEIVTLQEYVTLSNAPALAQEIMENGFKRVRFATTRPLPSYLVAVAVGPLDVVEGPLIPPNAWREEALQVRGVSAKGKGAGLEYALANTAVMVEALEAYFELSYPYEKLDLVAVPEYAGAMENPGLIVYSEYLLLMGDNPSIRQQESFGASHAHELAHQWLGNLVTMAWWDDLWLNEAFADWVTEKVMRDWRPELHYERRRLESVFRTMDEDSLTSIRSVRQPVDDAAGMFAAFDNVTYVKGAAILTMVENYIGKEAFRQGLRNYLQRFAHGNADVFDLVESLEEAAGDDGGLAEVIRTFLFQPGLPMVTATVDCSGAQAKVVLQQSRYLPLGSGAAAGEDWAIPVCMSWGGNDNATPADRCLLMQESVREVSLGTGCPAWIMPNRSATGYYRWDVTPTDYSPIHRSGRVLNDVERMALADSLAASVHAGRIGIDAYLRLLPVLAAALERSAAMAPVNEIRRMLDYLIEPGQRADAMAYFGAVYGRRLEFLDRPGGAEPSPERERFRFELTRFLAEQVRDPEVRSRLAKQAAAYMGLNEEGDVNPETSAPDLISTVLTVGVQDLGADFFDRLVDLLSTETAAAQRSDLLRAIGGAEDPVLQARARNLLLDDALLANEVASLLWALAQPPGTAGTWNWFVGNRTALIERYPGWFRYYLPLHFASFCDGQRVGELESVFRDYEDSIPGITVSLRQAEETIAICETYRTRNAIPSREFFDSLDREEAP
jgi:alanyl aminopeptidase